MGLTDCMWGFGVVGVLLTASPAHAQPSRWSDSERPGDLVYFGLFGGTSLASASRVLHRGESGGVSEIDGISSGVSFNVGYAVTLWPYDFFAFEIATEGFGLPMMAERPRYDACNGCRLELTAPYEGFGTDMAFVARTGLPLRFVEPMIGAGLVTPVTFQFTVDPETRLDTTAFDAGLAVRGVGGLAFFVVRDLRLFVDYRVDYRFVTINAQEPLENEDLIRHSAVTGFMYSPDSYKESPSGDRFVTLLPAIGLPALFIASMFIARAALTGEDL